MSEPTQTNDQRLLEIELESLKFRGTTHRGRSARLLYREFMRLRQEVASQASTIRYLQGTIERFEEDAVDRGEV